jgi:hypothetical protein
VTRCNLSECDPENIEISLAGRLNGLSLDVGKPEDATTFDVSGGAQIRGRLDSTAVRLLKTRKLCS